MPHPFRLFNKFSPQISDRPICPDPDIVFPEMPFSGDTAGQSIPIASDFLKTNIIDIVLNIDADDYVDVTKEAKIMLEYSKDDGTTWRDICGMGWKGGARIGRNGEINPSPRLKAGPLPEILGSILRVRIITPDIGNVLRVGLTATLA
jgi:hypothetical protein